MYCNPLGPIIHPKQCHFPHANQFTERELDEITEDMKKMSDEDVGKVIDELSDSELKKWLEGLNGTKPYPSNGCSYDGDKRADAYKQIAKGSDGPTLLRIHKNLPGYSAKLEFANAVATSASGDAKNYFVDKMAEQAGKGNNNAWNVESIAAVSVLEKLNKNELQSVIPKLSVGELETLAACAQRSKTESMIGQCGGNIESIEASPERLVNILKTAENMTDENAKARLFKAAASQLEKGGDGSPSARIELYNLLARNIDDVSVLLNAHDRLASSERLGEGQSQYHDAQLQRQMEFADAVAKSASPDLKKAYIEKLAERLDGKTFNNEWSGDTTAVVRVLETLKAGDLQSVLSKLDKQQLEMLVSSAVRRKTENFDKTIRHTASPEPLVKILETAAQMKDVNLKARLFEVAALQLKKFDDAFVFKKLDDNRVHILNPPIDKAQATIADALTKLVKSDVTGMVGALESQKTAELKDLGTGEGKGLSAYMESMVAQGKGETVGDLIKSLRGDNPKEFMNKTNSDGSYQNAESLGYFTGSMRKGINELNQKALEEGKEFSAFMAAGKIASLSLYIYGIVGSLAERGMSVSLDQLEQMVNTDLANGIKERQSLADRLEAGVWPADIDGTPKSAYETTRERVVR
ncbi:MAG: hypothetical protein CSB44_02970 [Gammaproteobacteria bacterium]|nr:MAG: hypothetical protein CSB44_02970 [Gammaproteobacteria bacterium]